MFNTKMGILKMDRKDCRLIGVKSALSLKNYFHEKKMNLLLIAETMLLSHYVSYINIWRMKKQSCHCYRKVPADYDS